MWSASGYGGLQCLGDLAYQACQDCEGTIASLSGFLALGTAGFSIYGMHGTVKDSELVR